MKSWHKILLTTYYTPFTKKAFTLAEVLITLGIIGVVATMTITVLVPKIQDMQFKEAAKEAFSKASQAIQLMKVDNGGDLSAFAGSSAAFYNSVTKYFKTIDTITNVPSVGASNIYKTSNGHQGQTYWMAYQFIATDGMFWAVNYWNSSSAEINKYALTVDVNGYQKAPNVYGRDVFMFQIINGNLLPMGGDNTAMPASTECQHNSNNDGSLGLGCMQYVMQGIDY